MEHATSAFLCIVIWQSSDVMCQNKQNRSTLPTVSDFRVHSKIVFFPYWLSSQPTLHLASTPHGDIFAPTRALVFPTAALRLYVQHHVIVLEQTISPPREPCSSRQQRLHSPSSSFQLNAFPCSATSIFTASPIKAIASPSLADSPSRNWIQTTRPTSPAFLRSQHSSSQDSANFKTHGLRAWFSFP